MSMEMPVVLVRDATEAVAETGRATGAWIETAVAALFTISAVVLVSFLAVMTGLV